MRYMKIVLLALMVLSMALPALAQDTSDASLASQQAVVGVEPPDYVAWGELASVAEDALGDRRTSTDRLAELRAQLVEWRTRFTQAQTINGDRLSTVRTQLDTLGPPPEEGVTEAPEIAERREALRKQIVDLQAPSLAAEEAFTRATGLIGEIDTITRERQTEALLELYPTPVNPALWPSAISVLSENIMVVGQEVVTRFQASQSPTPFRTNLPLIGFLAVVGFVLIGGSQNIINRGVTKIAKGFKTRRGRNAFAILISTGRIVFPTIGIFALVIAAKLTGLVGPSGLALLSILPYACALIFAGIWLATSTFPEQETIFNPLGLDSRWRREGRFLVILLGVVTGIETIRQAWLVPQISTEEVLSVLSAPLPMLGGFLLWRLGAVLKQSGQKDLDARLREDEDGEAPLPVEESAATEEKSIFNRLMHTVGAISRFAGIVGVLLLIVGYVPASLALIFPLILSLALIFFLLVLILLETDLLDVLLQRPADSGASLMTSLVALGLVLGAIPVFALIWGMRPAELFEIWVMFRDGFSFGETRIRPTDFLVFLLIFSVGYTMTKVLQGVISSSVLPKTKIDRGSQKAMISGLGYVGVFISALLAFTLAGIDLSSLAIVLGALSVGIGFGLQNIVSNFVSGIILLIERPISEGDWIEVNGVMGTVRGVSVRSTTIETFDRTDVIVPNADLVSGSVTNWTRFNKTGRLIIKVGVAYGTDTRKIITILERIGRKQDGVSMYPTPPQALFRGFGDSSLNFELRLILQDVSNLMTMETEVHHQIAEEFTKEGIEIPFVQRDLWIRNPEALRACVPDAPKDSAE